MMDDPSGHTTSLRRWIFVVTQWRQKFTKNFGKVLTKLQRQRLVKNYGKYSKSQLLRSEIKNWPNISIKFQRNCGLAATSPKGWKLRINFGETAKFLQRNCLIKNYCKYLRSQQRQKSIKNFDETVTSLRKKLQSKFDETATSLWRQRLVKITVNI